MRHLTAKPPHHSFVLLAAGNMQWKESHALPYSGAKSSTARICPVEQPSDTQPYSGAELSMACICPLGQPSDPQPYSEAELSTAHICPAVQPSTDTVSHTQPRLSP